MPSTQNRAETPDTSGERQSHRNDVGVLGNDLFHLLLRHTIEVDPAAPAHDITDDAVGADDSAVGEGLHSEEPDGSYRNNKGGDSDEYPSAQPPPESC